MTKTATAPELNIREIVADLGVRGPTRILIDAEGTAVTPQRAATLGVRWDACLVRDDGWTLGFPTKIGEHRMRPIAEAMWHGRWQYVVRRHSMRARRIENT